MHRQRAGGSHYPSLSSSELHILVCAYLGPWPICVELSRFHSLPESSSHVAPAWRKRTPSLVFFPVLPQACTLFGSADRKQVLENLI